MRLFLVLIIFLASFNSVFASAKSDFDYQFTKHRENFNEFNLYKSDYLNNQSLDNQQKALLSAKQTINTRELTRASFAAYLRELISQNKLVNNSMVDSLSSMLLATQQYFLTQSQKSLSIVTLADLDNFNESYLQDYPNQEKVLKAGIVGQKLAKLKYFSLRQQEALNDLRAKIPSDVSVRVFERINTLENNLATINKKIDDMSEFLMTADSLDNAESEIFFSSRIELISEIRSLQLAWMDQLIDLDINYAKI